MRCFFQATGGSLSKKSMRDREAINRFVSFYLFDLDDYPNGDMDEFLVMGIKKLEPQEKEEMNQLRNYFELSMELNFKLFRDHSFRKSILSPNSRRTLINISLFDVLSVSFAKFLQEIEITDFNDFDKIVNIMELKKNST